MNNSCNILLHYSQLLKCYISPCWIDFTMKASSNWIIWMSKNLYLEGGGEGRCSRKHPFHHAKLQSFIFDGVALLMTDFLHARSNYITVTSEALTWVELSGHCIASTPICVHKLLGTSKLDGVAGPIGVPCANSAIRQKFKPGKSGKWRECCSRIF